MNDFKSMRAMVMEEIEMDIEELKRCSKCREHKPFEDFHQDKHNKYGIQSQCRECKDEGKKEQESGIYKLWFYGIDGNLVEYIGSTEYLKTRESQHINELKNKIHYNKRLQEQFNLLCKAIGIDKAKKSICFEKYPITSETKRYYKGLSDDKDYLSIYLHDLEKKAIQERKEKLEQQGYIPSEVLMNIRLMK